MQAELAKEEMDAVISSSISPGCHMHINTVPSIKINNEEVKPRAMLSKRKRDSSVFRIKWNHTMLFVSVRRLLPYKWKHHRYRQCFSINAR